MTDARRLKHRGHPLRMLFDRRRFTELEGMNWLQGNGWISDLCVEIWDVAPADVVGIMIAAGQLGKCIDARDPERHVLEARVCLQRDRERDPRLMAVLGLSHTDDACA
jgi:hypothetical protein